MRSGTVKWLYSTYLFPTELAKSTREIQKILKYETQLSGDLVCLKTKKGIICGFIKHTLKFAVFYFSQLCGGYNILLMMFYVETE